MHINTIQTNIMTPDKILCDHDHFNDCINEEMARDFIAPN